MWIDVEKGNENNVINIEYKHERDKYRLMNIIIMDSHVYRHNMYGS